MSKTIFSIYLENNKIELIEEIAGRKSRNEIINIAINEFLEKYNSNKINPSQKLEMWMGDYNVKLDYHNSMYKKFGSYYETHLAEFMKAGQAASSRAVRLNLL